MRYLSAGRVAGEHHFAKLPNRLDARILLALVAAKFALHLPVLVRHDWNRDELYFLECGRRLAAGYVDHAPLVPWVARACEAILGTQLAGLRLPSVVAGATVVALAVALACDLGGCSPSGRIRCARRGRGGRTGRVRELADIGRKPFDDEALLEAIGRSIRRPETG